MHPLVASNLEAIQDLCRKHDVLALALFGSAATGQFDESQSDVDFTVKFAEVPRGGRASAYFGLKFDLERLLGRSVDLVSVDPIRNPYVRASVEATKVPIYAAA